MPSLIGLGRRASPDDRDLKYLLPRKVAAAENIRRKMWTASPVLDQLNTSQCVAFATRQWLKSSPIRQDMPMSEREFYIRCQAIDPWPETRDGNDEGTSVRASMQTLVSLGLASSYSWAFSIEPVVMHLLANGPMIVGSEWTIESFTPDRWGYIHFGGTPVGGHAWLLAGCDRERLNPDGTKGALRMINSWGRGWGQNGRAWVSMGEMDLLLRNGEAAVANETKPPKAAA